MNAVINTVVLAVGALSIALPIGVLLAVLLSRFEIPGRKLALVWLGALLFLPLYVQLSAWDAALGKLGWLTLANGTLTQPFLAGMRGAIFVHGVAAIPWVALIVGIGLSQVDPAQEEAASLAARPWSVLWRVTFPQALPFLAAAALWTVAGTIAEMTVTNIYLINPSEWTLTERFYMSWSLSLSPLSKPAIMASLAGLIAITSVGFLFVSRSVRHVVESARPSNAERRPSLSLFATIGVWLAIGVLLAVPVGNLVSKAGFVVAYRDSERVAAWSAAKCIAEVTAAPARYRRECGGTIQTAALAATLALCFAASVAWPPRLSGWRAVPALSLTIVLLCVPGPVVGIALVGLFNHDIPPRMVFANGEAKSWLLILYDNTSLAPILAQGVRALPVTIMALWYSFQTLNRDVLSAAALDGLPPWRVFWKIAVRQRWQAIAATWIMAFAIAAGDLAWCHLVTPPGLDLLSRRIFGLVHSGVEEQVAAISLVIVMNYAVLACSAIWLINRQQSASVRRRPR